MNLKSLLPKPLKRFIILLRARGQLMSLWFFSRTRFLSSLYYCFFSRQFAREHQSVLSGRLAFAREQGMGQNSSTLLRRNIHRIEKGLIMQPRKALFALGYINATIGAFEQAAANKNHDEDELKWAGDVLGEYFNAVQLDKLDVQLKIRFDTARQGSYDKQNRSQQSSDQQSVPYTFATKIQAPVTSEAFLALCTQRRSVRWFEPKAVARVLLEQAVNMAALAPSACNRLPYQFYIADDKAQSQRLIEIPLGTQGFAQNVPCTIVVTADLANYPTERDRHLIYIDGALAAMQLMLALETLGLSSCPINWPDIERCERKMVNALDLPVTVRPIMLMAVGYGHADGKIPFSHKKSAQQLIHYVH
ncbi:MAG: nitroreductase family protein [Psychrosphaera sp.]|nr:nitroreductase family protein [Psychrosphaera sp.]